VRDVDAESGTEVSAAGVLGRTELVLDCLPRAIWIADLNGTIVAWNRLAERLFGFPASEVVGGSIFEVIADVTSGEDADVIVTAMKAGQAWSGDLDVTRADGTTVRTFSFVGPMRDEAGVSFGFVSTTDDVNELRVLEQKAAEQSEHLMLALAAGDLGTWRWDMATGAMRWDVTMERLFGLEPGSFGGTFEAWVSLLHPDDVEEALAILERAIADQEPYEIEHRVLWPDGSVHWLHGRGQVTVDATGKVTGTIGCTIDVTTRKRLELDAARRTRDAEVLAERERLQRERLEALTALDEAALRARDHRTLMRDVTAAVLPHLGDWCAVCFVPEPGAAPEVEVAHRDPTKLRWAKELQEGFPYDSRAAMGIPAVIRTGKTEFLRDVEEELPDHVIGAGVHNAPSGEREAIAEELQLTNIITVPLHTKRGVIGAMQFVSAESKRQYDHEDVSLAQAAAGRVAEALDNAWLTEQHRTIARTLQAALLPPRIPQIEGVSIAVRHWAAGAVSEVGGDFYDVFRVDDQRWALVIGDVCGTGPNAAAVTAIARHTIRAAATHGASAVEVLYWANDALHAGNRELFCTAIYSTLERLDGSTWRYTCAAAGHPLPLLVRRDGSSSTVGQWGTLLGVVPTLTVVTETVDLEAGDTLVLYTDGVTDVAPPYGLDGDALIRMVTDAAMTEGTAEDVLERLGEAIQDLLPIPERNDDMALVVVRVSDDQS
jgi:PAS domain S-box-containing protein